MEEFKTKFVDFLISTGALKAFENSSDDRTLKSKRLSSWFVNIGDFNEGQSSNALAGFYADSIINSGVEGDILYGIPDKGVGLAAPIAMAMSSKGHNIGWVFSRKDEKTHGEASNLLPSDRAKKLLVGKIPKSESRIIQLDDVFTAGTAKYEANTFLKDLGLTNLPLLSIGVDRQEVDIDSSGKSAIEVYQNKTGTPVISVVNATEIYSILKEGKLIPERALERMANYIRVYGTDAARKSIGRGLEQKIIKRDKSVIPAMDVPLEKAEEIFKQTADVEGIGGYKIPATSGRKGWETWVATARKYTDKPLIYDHQKAGTDIPDTGKGFMKDLKESGFDTVILFPQAGPETERAWIYHALDNNLNVIVGGRMTHPAYSVSEGGFITDEGALNMYKIAARAGINNFVVPGNKLDVIKQVKDAVEAEGVIPIFYAPGFVAQGGKISEATGVAGNYFHGIVGRGIYEAENGDFHAAAVEHCSQL